ncbi:MAG: imidazole glycerol phosphate synthase subunit HisH [Candidatus Omnitrophica bacterium]|nr:imidazole glycerol phosphate synthase subunit HisH [Candidatus Omnitrophota bacterium]
MKVVIIDYGLCNLLSVHNALRHCGVDAVIAADPAALSDADGVILPGVGAFEDGMSGLRQRGFMEALGTYVPTGRPLLGICLGMQLLMERSCEFGVHDGLGLIKGEVRPVDHIAVDGGILKIPHIGWNGLRRASRDWEGSLLTGLPEAVEMYFVHSFRVVPQEASHILAETEYGGKRFCSVVARENIWGCQFHPEKSSAMGLKLLNNFVCHVRKGLTHGAV